MVNNVSLRLTDKIERRIWIDDTIVPESLLKRFFRALNKATTLDECENIIKKVNTHDGYNPNATYTYIYNHGGSEVKYQKCNYDAKNDVYKRSAFIGRIEL